MFQSISSALVWRGILAIIIGLVSVAWPDITVRAFAILFAMYAFMVATTDAVRAFSSENVGQVVGYVLLGVLSLTAGAVALIWPDITALVLTLAVSVWALATGVVEVGLAFRQGEAAGRRAMWALSGLVSIALGVVLAIRPDIGAVSLATVFGLFSIVSGVSALVLAAETKGAHNAAERRTSSTA